MTNEEKGIRTSILNTELIDIRRQLIITESMRLFLQKGFHQTTTAEIASACGFSPGTLYRYIGSKQDIIHLIALRTSRTAENAIKETEEIISRGNLVEALKNYIKQHITNCDLARNTHLFVEREISYFSHEDRTALLRGGARMIDSLALLLRAGVAMGVFKVRSPIMLSHEIHMLGWDWALRLWFLKQHFNIEEYIRINTENILDIVLIRRGDK